MQSETVVSEDAPDRKLHTVTPAGRAELHRWFLSPIENLEASRDGLHAKILLALTGDVPVEQVIQAERKAQLQRIGQLTKLKEQHDPELELAAVLQLDLSIVKTEAVIRWLDTAEAKIAKAVATGAVRVAVSKRPSPVAAVEAAVSSEKTVRKGRA